MSHPAPYHDPGNVRVDDHPNAPRETYTDKIAAFFKSRAGEWIDGRELGTIGGVYAWRTRVAEARRTRGMRIDNRQRKEGQRTVSEYRYVPDETRLPFGWSS
jgi:hypothetical protein|tara:strand:+ start:228 stop:533 length:306 start_codon:yes stop_codon:yes gene_type:complete